MFKIKTKLLFYICICREEFRVYLGRTFSFMQICLKTTKSYFFNDMLNFSWYCCCVFVLSTRNHTVFQFATNASDTPYFLENPSYTQLDRFCSVRILYFTPSWWTNYLNFHRMEPSIPKKSSYWSFSCLLCCCIVVSRYVIENYM